MTCEMISSVESIADFLVWPTSCHYYFWLWIILAITAVVVYNLYSHDKKTNPNTDFMNSLGVGSIAMVVMGAAGTLIKNTANIPMIQDDIMLILLALAVPILAIWFFKE